MSRAPARTRPPPDSAAARAAPAARPGRSSAWAVAVKNLKMMADCTRLWLIALAIVGAPGFTITPSSMRPLPSMCDVSASTSGRCRLIYARFETLSSLGQTRKCKQRAGLISCSAEGPQQNSGEGSELPMSFLKQRIQEIQQREVDRDRLCAKNWREGRCLGTAVAVLQDDWVRQVRLSDNLLALGTYQGSIRIFDVDDKSERCRLEGHTKEVTTLHWDGQMLISGSEDGTVRVWRDINLLPPPRRDPDAAAPPPPPPPPPPPQEARLVLEHNGIVTGLQRDRETVVSGSLDGTVRVWSLADGRCLRKIEVGSPVTCLAIAGGESAQQSRYLVVGTAEGKMIAYSMETWQLLLSFPAHKGPVRSVSFVSLRRAVSGGQDGSVRVWDLDATDAHLDLKGHAAPVVSVQADDTKVVTGALDGSVRVWTISTGQCLFQILGHTAYLGAAHFTGEKLVTDGHNNVAVLYDFSIPPP